MRSTEITLGRTFAVAFDKGDDFLPVLTDFCAERGIRQGFIPSFIAGFTTVKIVGTCDKVDNPDAPVWSTVHLTNVEAFGGGNLAFDEANDRVAPHIHVAVGLKELSASGYTSHLSAATVGFLTEMLVVEVVQPMLRVPDPTLHGAPLLRFGHE